MSLIRVYFVDSVWKGASWGRSLPGPKMVQIGCFFNRT